MRRPEFSKAERMPARDIYLDGNFHRVDSHYRSGIGSYKHGSLSFSAGTIHQNGASSMGGRASMSPNSVLAIVPRVLPPVTPSLA